MKPINSTTKPLSRSNFLSALYLTADKKIPLSTSQMNTLLVSSFGYPLSIADNLHPNPQIILDWIQFIKLD